MAGKQHSKDVGANNSSNRKSILVHREISVSNPKDSKKLRDRYATKPDKLPKSSGNMRCKALIFCF
jgi:hypothetical protein